MSLQDYEIFMQYFGTADQRPKNGRCEEGCVPVEEWYEPHKHKEKLIECFHHCMITGYEIDRTTFFDNYNRTYYYVYIGRVTVKISTDEYGSLWNEAANSFEEWRDNFFRSISKQGPTREEVMEYYIAPRPRSNGKLPLMPTARERMAHKNGCVELYNKLIREMGDGITEEHIERIPDVDHRTTDTPKMDVYCKNEDGTETYLGKGVIASQGTTAK